MEVMLRVVLADMQRAAKGFSDSMVRVKISGGHSDTPLLEIEYVDGSYYFYFRVPGVSASDRFSGAGFPDTRALLEYAKCADVSTPYVEFSLTKVY